MLLFFMELLEPKKTAQPQQKNPKDDMLCHRRTQSRNNRAKTAPAMQMAPAQRRKPFWKTDALIEGCGNEESLPYMFLSAPHRDAATVGGGCSLIAQTISLAAAVSYTMILRAI
jgi:hypothetical protein